MRLQPIACAMAASAALAPSAAIPPAYLAHLPPAQVAPGGDPVVIRDATGKVVFAGRTDGPYFLARLPAGRYSVTTHWDSWTFTKPVMIDAGDRARVVFAWTKSANGQRGYG